MLSNHEEAGTKVIPHAYETLQGFFLNNKFKFSRNHNDQIKVQEMFLLH